MCTLCNEMDIVGQLQVPALWILLQGTTWYNMGQQGTTWYNMVQHGTTWDNMVQHGTTWYNKVQHGTTC